MNFYRKFRIIADNAEFINSQKYSIDEVVEMISNGIIALSTDTITGLNGASYVRTPSLYAGTNGNWYYTDFTINDKSYPITTYEEKENVWYHLPQILKMLELFTNEADSRAFEIFIPNELKRCYCPFNKGIKRTFVRPEALELFGLSLDGRPVIKRKVTLQYSGVTIYNVDLKYLTDNVNRIMSKLKSLDDKVFMCDVYRVLKQLE